MPDIHMHLSDREIIKRKGNTYLFFIAIDEYKNGIEKLNNAVRDAKAIIKCLLKFYDLDEKYLTTLFNEDANKEEIENQFNWYINELEEEDNLILYFSGHGHYVENNNSGYWLTADSVKGKITTYYYNGEVKKNIHALKIHHFFGMIDSCFSGAFFTDRSNDSLVLRHHNLPSRQLLTSGRKKEKVSDGLDGEHSPFAQCLLTELRYQEEEFLRASILSKSIVNNKVFDSLNQTPRDGEINTNMNSGGDFIFLKRGQKMPILIEQNLKVKSNARVIKKRFAETTNAPNLDDIKTDLAALINKDESEWADGFNKLRSAIKNIRKKHILIAFNSRFNEIDHAKLAGMRSKKKVRQEFRELQMDILSFIMALTTEDMAGL